jgi:methanogenic corrinoid protein MtbC1
MEHFFSPRDVADAIGVSESSLKRWADEGLLQVNRTAGGHRRIALREALRYIRETGTPLARPEAIGLPAISAEASAAKPLRERNAYLVDSVFRGDLDATRGALLARYLDGETVASLCDGPLREALARVGELWETDKDSIYLEHRATDTCIHGLHYLRGFLPSPRPSALLALGGGPVGDPFLIPSLMAAVVLASEGWMEINLGANLPASALMGAMRKFRPQLVWISYSAQEAAESSVRDLTTVATLAREMGATLVAGGQALPAPAKLAGIPLQRLSSMEELAGFAHGIAAAHPAIPAPTALPATGG